VGRKRQIPLIGSNYPPFCYALHSYLIKASQAVGHDPQVGPGTLPHRLRECCL